MKIFTENYCNHLLGFTKIEDKTKSYAEIILSLENLEFLNNETSYNTDSKIQLKSDSIADVDNSIIIFENLKELTRVQANDKRLWTTLTHTTFLKYTIERWNINKEASTDTLVRRFHYEGSGLETRMRNSISRLWWAAKLTYDEDNTTDKYFLTKILWSKQDIFQNLVERSYGTYESVVKGFLEFYSKNLDLKEDKLRKLFTALNSIGGVKVLSALSREDVINTLNDLNIYYKD